METHLIFFFLLICTISFVQNKSEVNKVIIQADQGKVQISKHIYVILQNI